MTTAVPHAENSGAAWPAAPKRGETEALPLRCLPSAAAGSAPGRPAWGEKGGMLRAPPGWSKAVDIGNFGVGWFVHPRRGRVGSGRGGSPILFWEHTLNNARIREPK